MPRARPRNVALALTACALLSFAAAPAHAQDPQPPALEPPPEPEATEPPAQPPALALPPLGGLEAPRDQPQQPAWNPDYIAEPNLSDWLVIGVGGAGAITAAIIPPGSKHARGGVLFDESVRNTLRMKTIDGRYQIRDASDVGLSLAVTWPFLIDALFTTWYFRGNPQLAKRMVVVDAEAFAIVGALQEATTGLASRERPYARDCGTTLPDQSVDCSGNVRYRSFFSGHSALSFTSASLVCVHHLEAGLLGAPWDAVSCATAYGVAATTATFRVMGDMHYATDVITGALVGSAVGISIPLLRAHRGERAADPKAGAVKMTLIPIGAGLGIGGIF